MNYFVRRPWDPDRLALTPPELALSKSRRREFLKALGLPVAAGVLAPWLVGCERATEEQILAKGRVAPPPVDNANPPGVPARNPEFVYGRDETPRRAAAEYCNFYEFTSGKDVYQHVDKFEPTPWSVDVTGLCRNPQKLDLDDLAKKFSLEERAYRHRCVETWAMCVPWTGFPLADLLKLVDPLPAAKYVKFTTFLRPEQAPMQEFDDYPWAYTEGLTLPEALNPLAFIATGVFAEPLLKQHGAPVRLVVPWKYGYKSIKSIVSIELTADEPATFWNLLNPREYPFESNVDPRVPHPRWSQAREYMLGSNEYFDTQLYNGYGEWVAQLYA